MQTAYHQLLCLLDREGAGWGVHVPSSSCKDACDHEIHRFCEVIAPLFLPSLQKDSLTPFSACWRFFISSTTRANVFKEGNGLPYNNLNPESCSHLTWHFVSEGGCECSSWDWCGTLLPWCLLCIGVNRCCKCQTIPTCLDTVLPSHR